MFRPSLSRSAVRQLHTSSRLRQSSPGAAVPYIYPGDGSVRPPVHLDPAFNPSRLRGHGYFDREGFEARGRIEWPAQWGDQDATRHISNSHFGGFLETARQRFFQTLEPQLGDSVTRDWIRSEGHSVIVKSQLIEYRNPLTWPDSIIWAHKVSDVNQEEGTWKMTSHAWSVKQGVTALKAECVLQVYDYEEMRKGKMTDDIKAALEFSSRKAD